MRLELDGPSAWQRMFEYSVSPVKRLKHYMHLPMYCMT